MEWLVDWFGERFYMPHGHCYLWQPAILWTQVITNIAIGIAYMSITITLYYLVRKSRDIPFSWMFVAFGVFIVTCGFTHFSDVLVIWKPVYWLDGGLRAITAIASVGTAILLPPLVPKALALAEAARVAHERGIALEEANKNLAVLLDKTKELEQLKTQFFANVSHELRTPLALVLGPAEKLLARTDLPADARQDLDVIGRNARTLLKHVNDLLDVSKLEAGRMEVNYRRLDVAELVRVSAAHFDGIASERAIRIDVRATGQVALDGDADKLERVLLNLLSNAFKFTPNRGVIRCEVTAADDQVRIVMADSGPGIPATERETIFERFRQLDAGNTRRFGGTGLGLAIARDFVELHRGKIEVGDAPEGGAQFTVTVPQRAPEGILVADGALAANEDVARALTQQALDELRARTDAIAAATGASTRATVLVAEDNDDMRKFVADSLAGPFEVVTAINGRQALDKAREARPDLVVTDMMMPEMSGDELVRELRADERFDAIPIMLLTAKADDELRVRMLREGAQDYVMKPFAVEELRARATNLVTMKRAREVLQRELDTQLADLEELAGEVTQRKRQLQSALDAMRVARAHAESATRAKASFLGLVSHELRTPLMALELQLERLRSDASELTDAQKQIVVRMARTTARLGDLIESLLTYTRLGASRLVTEVDRFSLADVARHVGDTQTPVAEAKGLALRLEVGAGDMHLTSDPRLVRLVVHNLVDNALKYTSEGSVTVELAVEDACKVISVRDTGPGIRPEDQVRIFQPFEQLQAMSAKSTPGFGLGLSVVRDVVAALGGTLDLVSEVGKGSTFTLRLPDIPGD